MLSCSTLYSDEEQNTVPSLILVFDGQAVWKVITFLLTELQLTRLQLTVGDLCLPC